MDNFLNQKIAKLIPNESLNNLKNINHDWNEIVRLEIQNRKTIQDNWFRSNAILGQLYKKSKILGLQTKKFLVAKFGFWFLLQHYFDNRIEQHVYCLFIQHQSGNVYLIFQKESKFHTNWFYFDFFPYLNSVVLNFPFSESGKIIFDLSSFKIADDREIDSFNETKSVDTADRRIKQLFVSIPSSESVEINRTFDHFQTYLIFNSFLSSLVVGIQGFFTTDFTWKANLYYQIGRVFHFPQVDFLWVAHVFDSRDSTGSNYYIIININRIYDMILSEHKLEPVYEESKHEILFFQLVGNAIKLFKSVKI